MVEAPALALMLRRLEKRVPLDDAARAALLALPFRTQRLERHAYILREGERPRQCCLILSGMAYRHKQMIDGARQVLALHIPGDFVGLEGVLLDVADHNIQALSRCEIATVPREAVEALVLSHAGIAVALWIDTLIDAAIFREWVANVGRRDARSRLAHLLCEFALRLEFAGIDGDDSYRLPMTQELLADALGLTSVHVNRVLKALETDGLIERRKRTLRIPDWERLRAAADFTDTYLHLDQVPPGLARLAAG